MPIEDAASKAGTAVAKLRAVYEIEGISSVVKMRIRGGVRVNVD